MRRGGRVGALLVVTMSLAACGAVGAATDGPDSSEVAASLADDQQAATDAIVAVFDELEADGLEPVFASFDYGWCDRPEPTYRARSGGRLDHPGGRFSTVEDAEHVRDVLVELGWTPLNRSFWTDGIWETSNRWVLALDRDDGFAVNVYLYRDHSYVPMRVLGPCVEVPEEDEDAYTIDFESISLNELVGAPPRPVDSTTPATTE
ncbi:MAG: hypothetical protein ACRD0G_15510 [Acidimicrobiales bacterium]